MDEPVNGELVGKRRGTEAIVTAGKIFRRLHLFAFHLVFTKNKGQEDYLVSVIHRVNHYPPPYPL